MGGEEKEKEKSRILNYEKTVTHMQMDPSLKLETHQGGETAILQAISVENADAGGGSGRDWYPGAPALLFQITAFYSEWPQFHRPRASGANSSSQSMAPLG